MNQQLLPVIETHKALEQFLESSYTWCILMNVHVNFLNDFIQKIHQKQKKVIVHMELSHGIANDLYGTQFVCQTLKADGIISTKPKVIEAAKQNHCIAILRVFLLDSRSLKRSAQLIQQLQPTYVEVLPAILPQAVKRLEQYCECRMIGGGFVSTIEEVKDCLRQGMVAISTSNQQLQKEMEGKHL